MSSMIGKTLNLSRECASNPNPLIEIDGTINHLIEFIRAGALFPAGAPYVYIVRASGHTIGSIPGGANPSPVRSSSV